MYKNVHPNLALVLSFVRTEVECGKGLSRVFILVLAKCLSIQKFILGKVCLKAVVKVAVSPQRLASARQVKISNPTMIEPSQLPPKKKLPSTLNK